MQAKELLKYMENPRLLNKESVAQLQKLVNDFPYFQSANILLSMASKKWDASVYQQSLKKTAIVVTNRAHLFNLIHQLEEPETVVMEKMPEPAYKTTAQEVIAEVRIEKAEALGVEQKEDIKQDLDILKATEMATEATSEKVPEKQKPVLNPEEVLEKEIQNQVVNSFVEKEILKTPELHHTKPKEEPESFVEWLDLLKKNNGQTPKQIQEQVTAERQKNHHLKPREEKPLTGDKSLEQKREKNKALIDKIIESSPGIIRNKEDQKFFTAEIKAKESLLENEHLVTETLARIYALQGSVNKAVRAYEILSLKYPQKSAYFASLIQKLKNNQ